MTTDRDKGDMTVRTPVLSVTYGAFSLRLEGFDDPFATMRDVAEYFRAVLAEDRAFGTLPAEPEAEALRRVAEGRLGRNVEARATGGQVQLRAAGGAAPVRLRAVPDAGALFDEDAAPTPTPRAVEAHEPPAALPEADGGGAVAAGDPLSAAFEEARADALPSDPADAEEAPRGAARRPALPAGADEAAVERLISQADSALSGAEARRRQATFAHLKAAVAATRADVDAGGERRTAGRTAAEIARYRDDLAQSVGTAGEPTASRRPQRRAEPPEAGAPEPAAPPTTPAAWADPAPAAPGAPLIRAAEQRLAAAGDRVTSGRIRLETLTMAALLDEGGAPAGPAESGFARFLVEAAPADLSETIDAAAAYLAHVEGLEDFPRLQLMRLIAGREGAQDREAVMRSFGVLLREGRLRRSRRGQFEPGARSNFAEAAREFRRKKQV